MKNNLLLTTALVAFSLPAYAVSYDNITTSGNKGNDNGGVYWVTGGQSLTVNNAIFEENVANAIGGALGIGTGGDTLTVKKSQFLNNHSYGDGGAIGAYKNLSIEGSVFDGNTAQLLGDNFDEVNTNDKTPIGGGAVSLGSVSDATITSIASTTFKNNTSGTNGGAIGTRMGSDGDNTKAKLSIGATFNNNNARQNGGAIYNTFYANGGVNVKGVFEGNTAGNNGGAIYNDGHTDTAGNDGGVINVTDSTFSKNTAGVWGGAIYSGNSTTTTENDQGKASLTVKNSTFKENKAKYAGALATGTKTKKTDIKDTVFEGNEALEIGAMGLFGENNTLQNVTFTKNKATSDADNSDGAGALFLGAESRTVLNNVTFDSNTSAKKGGAIATRTADMGNNKDARLDILSSTFKNNVAATTGGAFDNYLYSSLQDVTAVYISDTTFENNQAATGGAIYNHGEKDKGGNTASTVVNASTFTGNVATSGGALYNGEGGSITLTGANTFSGNKAESFGGAIFDRGTLTVDGGTFEKNEAYSNGAITNFGTLTEIIGSTFTSNTAEADGGAVGIYKTAEISDSVFTSNTAGTASDANGGGAIFVGQTGNATLTNVEFYNNKSSAHGGAIAARHFANQGYMTLDTVTFDGNEATEQGGALASIYDGVIDITDSTFTNNKAGTEGGAIYIGKATNYGGGAGTESTNGGALNLKGTNVFAGNTAGGEANDIHNTGAINVEGELTLEGGITGTGTINFNSAILNAVDGTTVIANKATFTGSNTLNLTVAAGTTEVDLDNLFTNDENTSDNAAKYESNGLTLKNSMYTFTQDATELSGGNGSLYKVEQLSTEEIADNLGTSTEETEVLMSAISGSSNNQAFNEVANALSAAAQNGDASAVKEAQKLGADANPIVPTQETGTHEVLFSVVNGELNGESGAMAGMSSGDIFKKASAWIRGMFNKADHESTSKASGFNADTYGVAMGIDSEVNSDTRLGFGYAYSQTDIESGSRDTDVDTNSLFVYSQYKPADWYVNTVLAYSWSEYDESKTIAGYAAGAKYDVDTIALQSMYGYETKFKSYDLTPEFGFRYLHIDQDAYTDNLGTKVGANTEDVLTAVVGAKLAKNYKLENGTVLRPEVKTAVTYDLFDADNSANVMLANGASYSVDGEKLNRLGFEFGAKVTTNATDKVEVSAGYLTRVREDYQDHTLTLDAKYNF